MKPLAFDNRFVQLPDFFYSRQQPASMPSPAPIRFNKALAETLSITPEWFESPEAVAVFAGRTLAPGSEPIATVYAGHQFGHWNQQLGDGRAILLGEVIGMDGLRYDIQLKGAGQTPYSRGGDGRSPLGPVLREYIVSEAMAALGIPTTRSLAAVTTGEEVYRDSTLPGAILTRVARSHIRVGHFQFFSSRGNDKAVKLLADHVIERDYPDTAAADNPYLELLRQAIARQAQLIAHWQHVGFIHGVMNTDNMLICGETIDYGPCAFMDDYDPMACFSYIDQGKRYAYKNQPLIAQWNISWFAQALLPFLADNEKKAIEVAQETLNSFIAQYENAYLGGMLKKLGIAEPSPHATKLVDALLALLTEEKTDFTLTFRSLTELANPDASGASIGYRLPESFTPYLQQLKNFRNTLNLDAQQQYQLMKSVNPAYIPRNHLVEEAINDAQVKGDFSLFHQLADVLGSPYDYDPKRFRYTQPPQPDERVTHTFCGT